MSRLYIDVTLEEAKKIEKLLSSRIELAEVLASITCNANKVVIQIKSDSDKHVGRVFHIASSLNEQMLLAAITEIDKQLSILGINITN